MMVDKSHSKKDIVNLFKKHSVIIDINLTKSNILNNIDFYIKDFKYDEIIKNPTELKEYLKNVSPKQRPTTVLKNDIMFKSKKLIKWAKNDFILDGATYIDYDEPYNDVLFICNWGDISSVRRSCRFYNMSPSRRNHVNPIITKDVELEMNNNKILKHQYIYSLKIKKAEEGKPFKILFD
jgi:hypothetical protein